MTPVTAALMHITVKYLITFTPKCFVLAVAAVTAKLRAVLLNMSCKICTICAALLILCMLANSALAESQNSDISSYKWFLLLQCQVSDVTQSNISSTFCKFFATVL